MPPSRRQAADKNLGSNSQLVTFQAAAHLLNRDALTSGTLPSPEAIADFLDGADDSPNAALANEPSLGKVAWRTRGGTQQAIGFALTGTDGALATAIVGGYRPMLLKRPASDDAGRNQRVQWVPFIADELSLVAGSKVGIADGVVNDNDRWVDTITITTSYRPQPDPERLWGPKDATGALSPNNTPVWYIADFRGLEYGFVYVDLGIGATGAKVIEFPF